MIRTETVRSQATFYDREQGTDKEVERKMDTIKPRKGLGTLMGVFIPNSSDVRIIFIPQIMPNSASILDPRDASFCST